jgi:hypothetical protein
MTSLAAAQAAAESIHPSEGILCHSITAEQPAPRSDDSNGKVCADCCCIGCLTVAAAVLPPLAATAVPRGLSGWRAPLVRFGVLDGAKFNSHRPRGPPLA